MSAAVEGVRYRPDIDGLRAIAVLAVILYHFNASWLPGGFVGVDIFFVISGFVIIRIIMSELDAGTFSLVDFWERRVRRIVPAMVVVLGVVTVVSYFFLLFPIDLVDYGKSLMSQSVSISNWWFMRQSSYFAAPADSMPLLHMWTLSVEEQFYLLFPLLAVAVHPFVKRRFGLVMIGLAVASFAYGVILVSASPSSPFTVLVLPHVWGSATNSSAAFYFIISRFWELLVGGIIAVYALRIRNHEVAETVAIVGLAAIGIALVILTGDTPFPGVAALLPVLGTAAVIIANAEQRTSIYAVLSFPALVYIGLLSYSLYLWHWPLLVFARYRLTPPETLSSVTLICLLLATFCLACISYLFVESPIRKKRFLARREHLFIAALVSMGTLFAAGFMLVQNNGYPHRVPSEARLIAAAMGDMNPRTEECFTRSTMGATLNEEPCLLGERDSSHVDFVLWGDSHANAAMPAFDEYGRQTNQTGIFFGAAACPPLVFNKPVTNDQRCLDQTKMAVEYIQKNAPKELFIVSEWRQAYRYSEGSDFTILAPALAYTLSQLPQSTKITILLRTQTYPEHAFRDLFFMIEDGQQVMTQVPRAVFDNSLERFNIGVKQVAPSFANVRLINPSDAFCRDGYCYIGDDKGLYYADDSHLSVYGAMQILPLLLNGTQKLE